MENLESELIDVIEKNGIIYNRHENIELKVLHDLFVNNIIPIDVNNPEIRLAIAMYYMFIRKRYPLAINYLLQVPKDYPQASFVLYLSYLRLGDEHKHDESIRKAYYQLGLNYLDFKDFFNYVYNQENGHSHLTDLKDMVSKYGTPQQKEELETFLQPQDQDLIICSICKHSSFCSKCAHKLDKVCRQPIESFFLNLKI